MAEPAGLAMAAGALLLAFKGAVDSFVLFDAITEADNGQHFLALKYFIERQKLSLWADACKLDQPDISSLRHESEQSRKLIAGTLAEIKAINETSKKYLKRYDMKQLEDPKAADGSHMDLTTINTALVEAMWKDREFHRSTKRFLWATKDKGKFGELVDRLRTLVTDLYELTSATRNENVGRGLPVYVIPDITDLLQLQALQQPETDASPLVSLSALLKQVQISSDKTVTVKSISLDSLGLTNHSIVSTKRDLRQFCDLTEHKKLDRRVWIEWKSINAGLDAVAREDLETRITELARLVSAPKPSEYRVPLCLGLAQIPDPKQKPTAIADIVLQTKPKHFGFVYEYPSEKYDELKPPMSLLTLLQTSREMPVLNDRFKLAYALASSMSLLHASRWLHRGFRSSRVLFFHPHKEPVMITEPYITGFEYSRREDAKSSIEAVMSGDQAIDLYYHPDTAKGFNRLRDYYSLGIVLFEIALWRSFEVKIPKDHGKLLASMKLEEIQKIIIKTLPALGGVVGSRYRDVVELCLTGAFGHQDDQDGVYLGRAFFRRVVQELERCKV